MKMRVLTDCLTFQFLFGLSSGLPIFSKEKDADCLISKLFVPTQYRRFNRCHHRHRSRFEVIEVKCVWPAEDQRLNDTSHVFRVFIPFEMD